MTFTATVTGSAPGGTVTFFDGATQIGASTVSGGVASFTTSSLTVGSHSITAKYSGDSTNAASTSAVLTQVVGEALDSIKLRQLQVAVMPVVAQVSGQAISGAMGGAIETGFSGIPQLLAPNGSGFTCYFDPDAQSSQRATGGAQ